MSTNQNQNLTDGMHIIIDALKKNDIDTIYGVVGIPVTDMARHAQAVGIRYIGFRHEQSAGNAAAISGYITQKPGICLTVSAPGFLNGMVALANATTNGFPMIQISGSSNRAIIDLQQGDYEELDQMNISNPTIKDVSNAVIAIRQSKLPDPKEIGNSGSFFKNPIIDKSLYQSLLEKNPDIPHYPVNDTQVKVPAGWLIEQAGLKGYRKGDAGVHKKQALVLVNYGNATGEELINLAKYVQATVLQKFGIEINPEVNII